MTDLIIQMEQVSHEHAAELQTAEQERNRLVAAAQEEHDAVAIPAGAKLGQAIRDADAQLRAAHQASADRYNARIAELTNG